MKHPYKYYYFFVFIFFLLAAPIVLQAQTPGLIYKPATNGGNKILDPNNDGYVSKTNAGFSGTNDEGSTNSEIPYRPFPALVNEPLNDLVTGSGGGHTDLAPSQSAGASGSPISAYFDGNNVMVRVRLANQSTASKGYSLMIDSDGQYGNLVSGATPSKTPNPGFEFEIVLANNFDVSLYDHRNKPDGGTKIWTGSVDQYFQKSIAASVDVLKSNSDYFYDFYIPLTAFAGGITADTKLRLSGITITSAQSGISGTVSDVGGVNFAGSYNGDARNAWSDVINTFPPTSLNDLRNGGFTSYTLLPKPPVVTSPILSTDTSIKGTSGEAAGSTIFVYKTVGTGTPTLLGSTTIDASGNWTLVGIPAGSLAAGNKITATVSVGGKVSATSLAVTVSSTSNFCITTSAPTITGTSTGSIKALQGTTSYLGQQKITLYQNGSTTPYASYTVTSVGTAAPYTWDTGAALPAGMWAVTTTPTGFCESAKSNELCYNGNGNSTFNSQPDITLTRVTFKDGRPASTAANVAYNIQNIYGTLNATPKSAVSIFLFVNGVREATYTTTASTTAEWTINVSAYTFKAGDFISVRSVQTGVSNGNYACGDIVSKASNFKTIYDVTVAPNITGTYCSSSPITSISGTSLEVKGTAITLYNSVGGAQLGTTTVTSGGNWTVTGLSLAAGTAVYAKATASGKVESASSNVVTVRPPASNSGLAITTTPIMEGSTSLSGTGTAGDIITLYIGGSPYSATTTVVGSAWTISNISPLELYPGAEIWVTAKTANSCESTPSATKIVACNAPRSDFQVTVPIGKICYNTAAEITLSGSESGIIYNLYLENNTNPGTYNRTGTSILGTGGKISFKTGNLTKDPSNIKVTATKVGSQNCEPTVDAPKAVGVYPEVPSDYNLTATNTTGCPNTTSAITVQNALGGYTYQVYDVVNRKAVGEAVVVTTNGTFALPAVRIDVSGTYSVLITNTTTGCQTENINTKTVTITRTGPDVTKSVRVASSSVCVNTGTNIFFGTQTGYTYKLINKSTGTQHSGTNTVNGNGSEMSIATGNLAAGTYTFQIQVTSTSPACTSFYSTEVTVVSTNGVATVSAGEDATVCGNSYTLSASNPLPGTGKWTQSAGNPTIAVFSNDTQNNATVTNLASGTYTFTWTVTSTCGGVTSSTGNSVTIKVNCPAVGTVLTNKFISDYVNGEVIAEITDNSDGGLTSTYEKLSGDLPPGTQFSLSGNKLVLTVQDKSLLMAGNYIFTMRTTDAKGVTTDVPLSIRMFSSTSQPTPITPFPVELVYFTATVQNGKAQLQWLTASELDNKEFVVERSANGKTFEQIGTVAGNGQSSTPIKYSFTDPKPLTGTKYYRLKQMDTDRQFSYSKVIAVSAQGISADLQLQVYPNPFSGELNITITAQEAGSAQLQLLDMRGKGVHAQKVELQTGLNQVTLTLPQIAKGIYILRLTGNGINGTVKVLKN